MLALIIACMPFQIIAIILRIPFYELFPIFFHTVLIRGILGIKIIVQGTISKEKPTLFLSNHLSYLDIIALGSILRARFISKAEVADWPLFGFLAKLQNTVFIQRTGKMAMQQSAEIEKLFAQKKSLVLFPEGTSTDGTTPPKPFKSSLLQSVQGESAVTIQPVSVACIASNGRASLYPWYGDMTLIPHLWRIFSASGLTITLTFHPPFPAKDFSDRKALAAHAHGIVASGPVGAIHTH